MAIPWTAQQLQAIEANGQNILVAAAAGSGKTAVLVERIIRKICDKVNPVSVDRLLVLTFTDAAASEMKRKIANAISQKLQEDPENPWLRQQSLLVHSSHISTIHSFCKTILQNNIHATDLPADFSLIDEIENQVLRNQALDAVLDSYYKRIGKKEGFRDLAIGYGGVKTDDNLRDIVLKLYDFVQSLAYPTRWLRDATAQYRIADKTKSLDQTIWKTFIFSFAHDYIAELQDVFARIQVILDTKIPKDHKFYGYYQTLVSMFDQFSDSVSSAETIQDLVTARDNFIITKAPPKTGLDETLVAELTYLRDQLVKPTLIEFAELLTQTTWDRQQYIHRCGPRIRALKQLVRQTARLHQSMKRERSVLDFNDLEHEMIRLLSDKKGNPTPTARKLQQRFQEILVDEYQDTNNIQDTIFRLISGENQNLFMVGDLKQSIYKFRNAEPAIFAEKYKNYCQGNGGLCIRLFQNFRSRDQVVDTVNGIFHKIMTQQTGGLDYTTEEYLVRGATYPESTSQYQTEILLTDTAKDRYSEDSPYLKQSPTQLEAITVARRIRSLVENESMQITDKETGLLRPIRLGDIAVLIRKKKLATDLEQVFTEYNIPCISENGSRYLSSLEVMTVLSFLQIIDNPKQDIPLLAVLRSAMFDFSPDYLVKIRLCGTGCYYDRLKAAAEQGFEPVIDFLAILEDLRLKSEHMGVDELIWEICHTLQYMSLVGAMPGGRVRQANLNLLYERASEFEQGALHGLFHFNAYLENLRQQKGDFVGAKPFSAENDTVTILTIHKSKGLEFPVVILCGMDKKFNETDLSNSILWNEKTGLSMDYVDTVARVRYQTLPKTLTRLTASRDMRAEEMRLLYVALTRAKEKLILSAVTGSTDNKWMDTLYNNDKKSFVGYINHRSNPRDWVLSALLSHPESRPLREFAQRVDLLPDLEQAYPLSVQIINHETAPLSIPLCAQPEPTLSKAEPGELPNTLLEQVTYTYPHQGLTLTPVKLSISELKRRQMPEEDYVPSLLRGTPNLLSDTSHINAAERGTIIHFVMQHIDFSALQSLGDVELQLETMVSQGLISPQQRSVISAKDIYEFFRQPLGRRLQQADRYYREFDFYTQIPAGAICEELTDADQNEPVLLQGIADCFFFEDGEIVLIDYKTDRISSENAIVHSEQYRVQITCYAQALSRIFHCPVREQYLYYLHCKTAVSMDIPPAALA